SSSVKASGFCFCNGRLLAVGTLAAIMTEKEADELAAAPDVVRFIIKHLKEAQEGVGDDGWKFLDPILAVEQLAQFAKNRRLLVKKGVVPLLLKGIQSEKEEEIARSLAALMNLSFLSQNAIDLVKKHKVLECIVPIAQHSTDSKVSDSTSQTCRNTAVGVLGALWVHIKGLPNFESKADEISQIIHQNRQTGETATRDEQAQKQHVMLSYQTASRPTVKMIRDFLEGADIEVWMDIDQMGTKTTLQHMAEGVENAFAVIICVTERYKNSKNCRLEAEYAHENGKPIIPVMMQAGYKPDGWLGLVMGSKFYYDFSSDDEFGFKKSINKLLSDVNKLLPGKDTPDPHVRPVTVKPKPKDDAPDGTPSQTPPVSVPPAPYYEPVRPRADLPEPSEDKRDTYKISRGTSPRPPSTRLVNRDEILRWSRHDPEECGNQRCTCHVLQSVSFRPSPLILPAVPQRSYRWTKSPTPVYFTPGTFFDVLKSSNAIRGLPTVRKFTRAIEDLGSQRKDVDKDADGDR
ncbi:hypothetical protein BaRGS_00038583, partial [Batillaria attramentaria]